MENNDRTEVEPWLDKLECSIQSIKEHLQGLLLLMSMLDLEAIGALFLQSTSTWDCRVEMSIIWRIDACDASFFQSCLVNISLS